MAGRPTPHTPRRRRGHRRDAGTIGLIAVGAGTAWLDTVLARALPEAVALDLRPGAPLWPWLAGTVPALPGDGAARDDAETALLRGWRRGDGAVPFGLDAARDAAWRDGCARLWGDGPRLVALVDGDIAPWLEADCLVLSPAPPSGGGAAVLLVAPGVPPTYLHTPGGDLPPLLAALAAAASEDLQAGVRKVGQQLAIVTLAAPGARSPARHLPGAAVWRASEGRQLRLWLGTLPPERWAVDVTLLGPGAPSVRIDGLPRVAQPTAEGLSLELDGAAWPTVLGLCGEAAPPEPISLTLRPIR